MATPIIKPFTGKFSAILLFGPPGSGKGTLGQFLKSAGNQYHLTAGEIFQRLPDYTPAGQLFADHAKKGNLLPDEAAIEIWKSYVEGLIATHAFSPENQDLLLEGIPRTLKQAELLAKHVDVRHVIVLRMANEQELIHRLKKKERAKGHVEELDDQYLKHALKGMTKKSRIFWPFIPATQSH